MKKILLLVVGFVLGALATYLYCCKSEVGTAEPVIEKIAAPKGVITPSQAKVLDRAFDLRHKLINDSLVKQGDNRSSWYSLSGLRDYLDYAEHQAAGLGYSMNGIRIYLGAEPDSNGEAGLTTMFLIPTGIRGTASLETSEASMFSFNFVETTSDIEDADGFDGAKPGDPPTANYPQ
ncbi:hypothetical protein [Mangrovimonas xylaniphaga]|uniref:hypothetical protein n=1 Tax=Mangrovimonas xylaniphaga TaxID=1645915 RepID=UPI0006B5A434|nr:hypothetical protein [Mangrovimonas xylaniphaga]